MTTLRKISVISCTVLVYHAVIMHTVIIAIGKNSLILLLECDSDDEVFSWGVGVNVVGLHCFVSLLACEGGSLV